MKKSFYLSGLLLAGTLLFSVAARAAGPVFSVHPAPSAVCQGVSSNFIVAASDTPSTIGIAYQWQVSTDSAAWTDLTDGPLYSGSTNDTLVVAGDISIDGTFYRCIATDSHGSNTSGGGKLTVYTLPNAGTISGTSEACKLSTFTLSESVTGGTWSSVSPSIASIGTAGDVTALNQGFATIHYTVTDAHCSNVATYLVRVDTTVVALPISGPPITCVAHTIVFTNPNIYGTWIWSSADPLIADVSTSGGVTGYGYGTTTITYAFSNTCNSVTSTTSVSVDTVLAIGSITGPSAVCAGHMITLSESVSGGTWLSSSSGLAIVDMAGNVTGVSQGVATISYFRSNACGASVATHTVTVSITAATITGLDSVGIGRTRTYSNLATGGTWSVSDPSIATINSSTGVATGVDTGTATISYTVTNACGTTTATLLINVGPPPAVPAITGSDSVCVGATVTLNNVVATGDWTVDTAGHASVNSVTGVVTGISSGVAHVTYTFTNGFGSTWVTKNVVVHAPPAVSVTGPATVVMGGNYFFRGVPFGGTWSNTNPSVSALLATLDSAHLVSFGSFVIVGQGIDRIIYTASNTCGTRSDTFVLNYTVGVNNVTAGTGSLNVYPNPNSGEFTIHLSAAVDEQVSVVITNILGAVVKEMTMSTNRNNVVRMDQPAGMYFVNARTSEGKYSGKFTITR